jgi:uncharacterized protein
MPPFLLKLTAFYVAVNATILLGLALNVIRMRWRTRTPILDAGKPEMIRAIRTHANAAETIPIALILLIIVRALGGSGLLIHAIGIPLTAGRLLHATGLLTTSGTSFGRFAGMTLTALAILIGIVASLWLIFAPSH